MLQADQVGSGTSTGGNDRKTCPELMRRRIWRLHLGRELRPACPWGSASRMRAAPGVAVGLLGPQSGPPARGREQPRGLQSRDGLMPRLPPSSLSLVAVHSSLQDLLLLDPVGLFVCWWQTPVTFHGVRADALSSGKKGDPAPD